MAKKHIPQFNWDGLAEEDEKDVRAQINDLLK